MKTVASLFGRALFAAAALVLMASFPVWAANDKFVALCSDGTPEEIAAAVKAGADLNAPDAEGETPLSAALRGMFPHEGFAKAALLLEAGADPSGLIPGEENETPIHIAAIFGNAKAVKLFIDKGVDINQRNDEGLTPLISACIPQSIGGRPEDRVAIVEMLLAAGADVNATAKPGGGAGMTPLLYAAGTSNPGMIAALLAAGAEVNVQNSSGKTPLMIAAGESRTAEPVRLLLAAGANPNADANGRETPLSAARRILNKETKAEILKLLQEAGATAEPDED